MKQNTNQSSQFRRGWLVRGAPSELSDEEKTRKPRETNAAAKNERADADGRAAGAEGESLLHSFIFFCIWTMITKISLSLSLSFSLTAR